MRGNIYTVYEKPEAVEPTARVELVREGFSFWALVFGVLWLLAHRLWLAAFCYVLLCGVIVASVEMLGLSEVTSVVLRVGLQVLLAFSVYDLVRMKLLRRGYRFAGIIAADSPVQAQRRYYEFVT